MTTTAATVAKFSHSKCPDVEIDDCNADVQVLES